MISFYSQVEGRHLDSRSVLAFSCTFISLLTWLLLSLIYVSIFMWQLFETLFILSCFSDVRAVLQWNDATLIVFWQELTEDKNTKVHFIKCHCPFEVLKFYAEEMSFRAPLEVCLILCFHCYLRPHLHEPGLEANSSRRQLVSLSENLNCHFWTPVNNSIGL